tara:strand:+ start:622 stop:1350 length:729 start_codon:yes stop_codon:yes gene_type:complete
MNKTTVDLSKPSYYSEPDNFFYNFKRKISYVNILRTISKNLKDQKTSSLLEIGTGSGFLTSFLEKKYSNISIHGLEYDSRLVELTKSKLSKSIVSQGNAEDFDLSQKFDLIVSLQVIEHLYNPEKMLECVKKHLKDDGVFIFTTPNLGCLSDIVMKEKWHGYRFDHVSLKSRKDWDELLSQNKFQKLYSGSTFFSGIPILNKFPLGIFNWFLLYFVGSLPWSKGESYIGVFRIDSNKNRNLK